MDATSFDHVALWVDQRLELETVITQVSGMHQIERTDSFTLLGGDARGGKITVFDAEGPREQGCVQRVTIRVPQIAPCRARLEALTIPVVETHSEGLCFLAPGGVPLALVERTGEPDLHSIVLTVQDPVGTAEGLKRMGFRGDHEGLALGGRFVTLRAGSVGRTELPLLNHLALLVDSAEGTRREAQELGLEIDRVVDAANTLAVFVMGPEGILLEYVEHKPRFSLV